MRVMIPTPLRSYTGGASEVAASVPAAELEVPVVELLEPVPLLHAANPTATAQIVAMTSPA